MSLLPHQKAALYNHRSICFSETLESLYLNNKKLFEHFMRTAACKSTRYPKGKKKMGEKSCKTYLSTLDKVVCKDSEFNLSLVEILSEQTEEQFVREQHLTFDQKGNIYKPAFGKLFDWFKHEASLAGCNCHECKSTIRLLLNPEAQAEEQSALCLNCGCGKHYVAFGDNDPSCRMCHRFNPKDGTFQCLGHTQCCNPTCLRFFPNCRFHRMIELLSQRPEFIEPVRLGGLHLCNFCIVVQSAKRAWLQKVERPFNLAEKKVQQGIRKIVSKRKVEREMLKEMGQSTMHAYGAENLLTYRQTSAVMRKADENIEKMVEKVVEGQRSAIESFLGNLEHSINELSAKGESSAESRDLALASTLFHLGHEAVLDISTDASTVQVRRRKRKRKTTAE